MQFIPVPDYHMHTPRCNHAKGSVRDYADAAIRYGLKEIGMSDHSPMPGDFDKDWRMDQSEMASYLAEIEQTRDALSDQLTLRVGLEADFHPGTEAYVANMIATYDWDYVIGSVHYIADWGFDNPDTIQRWDDCNIDEAYCAYFELVAQSALTGMFDIIGHPDLIKKFGHRASPDNVNVKAAEESMLQAVLKSGSALEISSAGLRKPVKEIYPHNRIIQRAAELNIPFSFGSDAHSPAEVGRDMNTCLAVLDSFGVREIATFQQRTMSMQVLQYV